MQRETDTLITIEEKDGVGIIDIASPNLENIEKQCLKLNRLLRSRNWGSVRRSG